MGCLPVYLGLERGGRHAGREGTPCEDFAGQEEDTSALSRPLVLDDVDAGSSELVKSRLDAVWSEVMLDPVHQDLGGALDGQQAWRRVSTRQ